MTSPKKEANGQEQIAGALGTLLFFIPVLMGVKTEFTLFYMRQNFLVCIIMLVLGFLWAILPFLGVIVSLVNLALGFLLIFLAWKAYSGEKFSVPYLYDASIKVIKTLKLENFFTPSK